MSEKLKPCPCGKVPEHLILEEGLGIGYGVCCGNCCGVWSNGTFTVQHIDEDHVKVTKHWGHCDEEAVLCGGDFETILEALFVGAKVTKISKDNTNGMPPEGQA